MNNFLKVVLACGIVLVGFQVLDAITAPAPVAVNIPTAIAPPQSSPEQLAKAAKCKAFLDKDRSGIWRHYMVDGSTMTVEVGPVFYAADFETKQALNGFMRCVATGGRMDNTVNFIDYLNVNTHHDAATWSPAAGLEVK